MNPIRLVLQIFGTILLASLFLGGLLMMIIDFDNASKIETLHSNPLMRLLVGGSSPAPFRIAGILWLLLGLGAGWGIGLLYLKKHLMGLVTGIALFVVMVITVVVQPSFQLTENDPRYTGYAIAFFGLGGIVLLVLLHTVLKTQNKQQNSSDGIKGM